MHTGAVIRIIISSISPASLSLLVSVLQVCVSERVSQRASSARSVLLLNLTRNYFNQLIHSQLYFFIIMMSNHILAALQHHGWMDGYFDSRRRNERRVRWLERRRKKSTRGVISGICVGAFGGRTFSLLTRASRYYYRQLQNYYFLISIMLC